MIVMPKTVRFEEVEWEDPPRGYYLTDVKQKTLWVDKETGATVVSIVDSETGEVIKKIPPDEILSLKKRIGEMIGLLLDEKA